MNRLNKIIQKFFKQHKQKEEDYHEITMAIIQTLKRGHIDFSNFYFKNVKEPTMTRIQLFDYYVTMVYRGLTTLVLYSAGVKNNCEANLIVSQAVEITKREIFIDRFYVSDLERVRND